MSAKQDKKFGGFPPARSAATCCRSFRPAGQLGAAHEECAVRHSWRRDLRLGQRRHIETIQHMLASVRARPLLERLYTI
jgi:hypothetical protein